MRLLARGENAAMAHSQLRVAVETTAELDVSALLLDRDEKVAAEGNFVFYNQPVAPGVAVTPGGLDLDLGAVAVQVESVLCIVSVEDQRPVLGLLGPLRATVSDPSGASLFEFALRDLAGERAVVAFEFYRRQGAWKVRAVGQGYDGGLAALVTQHGVEVDSPAAPTHPVVPTPVDRPRTSADTAGTAGPAGLAGAAPVPPGTSDPERQFRVLTGIFEDAARSAAGYRSAVDFAEQRRERDLGSTLDDPRLRGSVSAATQMADEKYADLVTRATADHRRDVDALADELRALTPELPAALAPWSAAVWRRPGGFGASAGVRAGELHLPEAPDLLIPLLISVPLRRPLWFDVGDGSGPEEVSGTSPGSDPASATGGGVTAMVRAVILRLLAADSSIRLHLCDTDGGLAAALGAVAGPDSSVLGAPVARNAGARTEMLRLLAERIDLLEMARQAGALDALAARDERALLVVTDVPTGFGELDLRCLRYLVERSGRAVQLVLVGTPADSGATPDIARASLRLGPGTGGGISDGWVGLPWIFTPDHGPADPTSIVFRS